MSIKSQTPGIAADLPLMEKQRGPDYLMGKKEKRMPLHKGKSEKIIGENIEEMQEAGHPHKVAVAASLHEADEYGKKSHKSHSHHGRHKEHR
jgi:hypothetical protein